MSDLGTAPELRLNLHRIPDEMVVGDWEELIAKGRIADAVVISTLVSSPRLALELR